MDTRAWVAQEQDDFLQVLKELVEMNTFTTNRRGVDDGMDKVSQLAENMGFAVQVIHGRHRLIKRKNGTAKHGKRFLMISHVDTVHPPDDDFLHYEPQADGYVRGPGIGDMKAGLLMGLWTLKALKEMGSEADVQLVISADEEMGSPSIREWYTSGEHAADFALGLEPGFPQGTLAPDTPMGVVYKRKGSGFVHFKVTGQPAHAGGAWEYGLSAVEAVAQRITRIHALSDFARGITTNVGVVHGGSAQNTVAASCEAEVNFRFFTQKDSDEVQQKIHEIINEKVVYNKLLDRWEDVEILDEVIMPPMEATDENQYLIDLYVDEATQLGQNVVPIVRGGGSDANYIAASGTPAICGMGAPAEGIHTTGERIHIPMLFERTELLINTVKRLIKEQT